MTTPKLPNEPEQYTDHFGGIMDISALNLLWGVLVLPLGWLFKLVTDVRKNQEQLANKLTERHEKEQSKQWQVINGVRQQLAEVDKKADKAVNEQRVREILKEEMEPVRGDIRALTTAVSEIPVKVQQSIHALELKLVKAQISEK